MSVVNKRSIVENETEHESISIKHELIPHSQLFLRPDVIPALTELIKHYKWHTIYYIYNYDAALSNLDSLLDLQNKNLTPIDKILIRKITDIQKLVFLF